MSQSKNRYEAERWLRTAEEDLRAVETLLVAGLYSQACFHAQLSAEKALRALWYLEGVDPWGHSVQKLVVEFPRIAEIPNSEAWVESAALLDKFYIPTRYPNGLPDLTPGQVYRQDDAQRGLEAARALVAECRRWMAS